MASSYPYYSKHVHDDLPRVKRALDFLASLQPGSLLDAGSGRGVSLWLCRHQFPGLDVTAVNLLLWPVEFL